MAKVFGDVIQINDNAAWCWFQDERSLFDPTNQTLLVGSVAASEGPGGAERAGNVEIAIVDVRTGETKIVVLHERLEADDHNVPALYQRPDGRYLAMYAKHKTDNFSRWRVSENPHDATTWREEQVFDWTELTGGRGATYSNLHLLASEGQLYNFVRAVNDDPSIMVSDDHGDSWRYAGKLLTEPKIGYVNGYTRYSGNGVDRIDFITTDHHPRDFNNSIYHGYIAGQQLHRADGSVLDEDIFDDDGKSQTQLTVVFGANTEVDGELMTHAWTADLRRDSHGNLAGLITCRAGDVPENSNFDDHRFFYARFDGTDWTTHQVAKAGPKLWDREQDYTGLGAIDPNDLNTIVISSPVDPRTNEPLAHHELFKGVTTDFGASWTWEVITEDSDVDNLRPMITTGDPDRLSLLWFRGTMTRSQNYNAEAVAIISPRH